MKDGAEQSPLNEFLPLMFPSVFRGERRLFMLAAYLDESGSHAGSPVYAVAGYLAQSQHWLDFDFAWRRILAQHGLEAFHMADFENRIIPPYSTWDNTKRLEVFVPLLDIIAKTALVGIGIAVVREDFARLSTEEKAFLPRTEYQLCAEWCIGGLVRWKMEQGIKEPIAVVCELGAVGKGDLLTSFERAAETEAIGKHLTGIHFFNKEQHAQLQAADIIAYETPKATVRALGTDTRPIRKSLEGLLKRVHHRSNYFDTMALRELAGLHSSISAKYVALGALASLDPSP